jgi:hypothetical protein
MAMTRDLAEQCTAFSDPADRRRPAAAMPAIDWRAVRNAGRACCCLAKPVVAAVMPPAPGRDHATDLLLCGHHYRASREALVAAGAAVFDDAGRPVMPQTTALASAR